MGHDSVIIITATEVMEGGGKNYVPNTQICNTITKIAHFVKEHYLYYIFLRIAVSESSLKMILFYQNVTLKLKKNTVCGVILYTITEQN